MKSNPSFDPLNRSVAIRPAPSGAARGRRAQRRAPKPSSSAALQGSGSRPAAR